MIDVKYRFEFIVFVSSVREDDDPEVDGDKKFNHNDVSHNIIYFVIARLDKSYLVKDIPC